MQRSSKDVPEGSTGSSSSSKESETPGVLPRTVSVDDGALKKAALQVQKDLAGVEIPEVTSVAAQSAAATAPLGSTPLAAGQEAVSGTGQTSVETSRLSPALLRALDAETEAQPRPQPGIAASLAVQPAESRRGTGDSVAEPLPASAYKSDKSVDKQKAPANAGKSQTSRFAASPRGGARASYSDSQSSASDDDAVPPAAARDASVKGAAAEAMGLTVAVKAASRMRTESDISQDAESPSSARPLLAGTSSAALAAAPGSVHVSPKGSVVGFMHVPSSQHPLHHEDDTMASCCCCSVA